MTNSCFLVRRRKSFNSSCGSQSQLLKVRNCARLGRAEPTSPSISSSKLSAVATKLQTMAATSSAPCVSLDVPLVLVVRIDEIWPPDLTIEPVALLTAIVALTPAFLDSRLKVSSNASDMFVFACQRMINQIAPMQWSSAMANGLLLLRPCWRCRSFMWIGDGSFRMGTR